MARLTLGAIFALAAWPAVAADAGWSLQFHYDAFEEKTYPMAIMGEQVEGTSFDNANLFMACKDGEIAVVFQPERYSFTMADTIAGRFRGAGGVEDFTFSPVELPAFGRQRAIEGDQAKGFIELFLGASGSVPFQSDERQGDFPLIGFTEVHAIMSEHCAAL